MTLLGMVLQRSISICIFFLLVIVPLLVNPTALDYWYKPKIESVYGLICIIIVAVIVRYCICKVHVSVPKRAGTVFLFFYCCSAVISTILSIDRTLSLRGDVWRYEGIFTLLSYAMLVIIFAELVESRLQAKQLLKWLLVSAFLVALYAILQYLGFNPTKHFIPSLNIDNVIRSTIGNGNFLGKFLVLTGPLFAGYCLYKNEKKTYIFCGIAFFVILAGLVLSMARASWLGFACAGIVFFCMVGRYGGADQKRYAAFFAASIAGVLLVLGIVSASGLGSFNLTTGLAGKARSAFNFEQGQGSATRLFVWGKTLPLIREKPWFGYGPDTHEQVYKVFNLEYSKRFNNWVVIDRAHNNYIDMTIAQGLFGLLSYCGILGSFLFWLWRTLKNEQDNRLRMLFCAIFSSYCGYLINDFFSFSVVSVSPTFWALMGLTYALKLADSGELPSGAAAGM
jgi:O-antigen ligase